MNQTETNLQRIRAYNQRVCDEWDESKHPRAANGQFGSGGGSSKKSNKTIGHALPKKYTDPQDLQNEAEEKGISGVTTQPNTRGPISNAINSFINVKKSIEANEPPEEIARAKRAARNAHNYVTKIMKGSYFKDAYKFYLDKCGGEDAIKEMTK